MNKSPKLLCIRNYNYRGIYGDNYKPDFEIGEIKREEKIVLLVANDLIPVMNYLQAGKSSYLSDILEQSLFPFFENQNGFDPEDFVPYAQIPPEILTEEFTSRLQDICKNQRALEFASQLLGYSISFELNCDANHC